MALWQDGMQSLPREPKTAEKSNPIKTHDVSEKKTGSVQKDGYFQITHHFLTGFYRQIRVFCGKNTNFTKTVWKDDVSILNHEEHDVSIKNLQKGCVQLP